MPPNFQRGGPANGRGKSIITPSSSGRVAGKGVAMRHQRHRKVIKDAIKGVTRPAIRRLARRGGVKRISATIYDEVRFALDLRLRAIIKDCVHVLEYRGRKTVTVADVIFSLRRMGRPIYGFDPDTYIEPKPRAQAPASPRGA